MRRDWDTSSTGVTGVKASSLGRMAVQRRRHERACKWAAGDRGSGLPQGQRPAYSWHSTTSRVSSSGLRPLQAAEVVTPPCTGRPVGPRTICAALRGLRVCVVACWHLERSVVIFSSIPAVNSPASHR
mmetsp:Transcript_25820/g.60358  ORF Transcript_25820/g.60358 Transcript_25820/m.60358 type:complete len:128 (+) Transcript_25820:280-663(+)